MIKKTLNVLMCVSILLQNIMFAVPVMAEEEFNEELEINYLTQNNNKLEIVNGVYQVSDISEIYVYYDIKNQKSNTYYSLETILNDSNNGYIHGGISSNYNSPEIIGLDINNKISTITYKLYYGDSDVLLDTKTITLDFTKYDEYNFGNANLYITEVRQGNKTIEYTPYGYEFNKIQDIVLKLKGEYFIDDTIYPVSIPMNSSSYVKKYTGSELNNGIEIKIPIKGDEYPSLAVNVRLDVFSNPLNIKPINCKNDSYCYFMSSFIDDNNNSNYNVGISYNNFSNREIKTGNDFSEYYGINTYVVSNKYHNAGNELVLNINGEKYLDQDYDVKINIIRDNNVVYTKSTVVNGLLLNDNYKVVLDNFVSSNDKTYEDEKDKYIIETDIDYTTSRLSYMYNYSEKYSTIESEVFFENGQKNLSTFRGDGGFYFNSGVADTNKDVFKKYNNIYIRYLGHNFDEDLNYDYEFSYGYNNDGGAKDKGEVIKTGKINGTVLNTVGLMFIANNKNNYRYPSYRLEIKHNNQLIYYSSPVLDLVDTPTFANVSLSNGNNKNLYLKMNDYTYISTKNFPIKAAINGIGFEDNKNYTINIYEVYKYKNGTTKEEEYNYIFKGKELNDGKAVVKLKNQITNDITSAYIYAYYDGAAGGFGQGGFTINFVDSKELLTNVNKYFIDNASDLIKNIGKKTSVIDFVNNIDVADNGKIKVYDKTGKNEITGNIGTGMIVRLTDKYDNNMLDLDAVVKGDVSGDGNISITDLVKVTRHLSGDEVLGGIYEVAGNVSDTGKIGITDLVKISRDVAKIQEVK